MKLFRKQHITLGILALAIIIVSSCERKISDDAVLPSFGNTAEVFTDDFIGLGSDFYFPFEGAKPDVFSVDATEGFESNASIRIDVPNATDPTGGYAGAIFRAEGAGRDLSGYDALTFYVKASQGVTLGEAGFGINYEENKYQTSLSNINLGTNWTKVIVPIPDPAKLTNERGLFWFAAGTQGTGGSGYALWFDEIKFEKLGTVGTPRGAMFNGVNTSVAAFVGSEVQITGLSAIFNLANGTDASVNCAPAFFNFTSSNPGVAEVNDLGTVTIKSDGEAEVTATLAGEAAAGKLLVGSEGALPAAPTPTHAATNVLSLFSDAYTPATVINYTPGFGGSTTKTTLVETGNGQVLEYTTNNYTGMMFDETPLDCSAMNFLHIDVFVTDGGGSLGLQIRDIGGNKMLETDVNTGNPQGDDKDSRHTLSGFPAGEWKSFDLPLNQGITNQKGNIGGLIITEGPDFILDNIYFHN